MDSHRVTLYYTTAKRERERDTPEPELLLVVSTCVVRRRVAHPLAYNVLKLQAPKSRDWSSII
jgi:hypothetical protein